MKNWHWKGVWLDWPVSPRGRYFDLQLGHINSICKCNIRNTHMHTFQSTCTMYIQSREVVTLIYTPQGHINSVVAICKCTIKKFRKVRPISPLNFFSKILLKNSRTWMVKIWLTTSDHSRPPSVPFWEAQS